MGSFNKNHLFALALLVIVAVIRARAQDVVPSSTDEASGSPSGTALTEPLRWKLKLGETLRYHMVEEMTLVTRGEPLNETKTPLHQEMDMTWTVVGVKADGEAVMEQKIENVKLTIAGPPGEKIEYDSKGDDTTSSLAPMVAPIYDALTKGAFEFTMTARGEIKDVKVSDEVLEALKNSPGAAMLGDIATAEGLQRMIAKWALVLPEKTPQKGEEWRSRVKLKTPSGEQVVESSYRYEGTRVVDGRTYAVFRPGLEMTFSGKEGARMKVKEQESKGEVLFDVAAGRLQSAKLERGVTIDMTVAGQTVEQRVKQSVEVKLAPAK
jgi:hypothetical protein